MAKAPFTQTATGQTKAKVTVKVTNEEKTTGLLLPILILTLLALLAGSGLGIQLASTVRNVVINKGGVGSDKPANPDGLRYNSDMSVEPLKPILTNLAAPTSAWVRIEASIVYKVGELTNPQVAATQIREDIMTYLRTLTLSQLGAPSAMQNLREDLNERAKLRVEGKLNELVIESLVVQ